MIGTIPLTAPSSDGLHVSEFVPLMNPVPPPAIGVGHFGGASTCADSFGSPRLFTLPFSRSTESSVTGVCQRDKEESLSDVGSSDVDSANRSRPHAIASPFEPIDNSVHPSCKEASNVLDHDDRGVEFLHDARELEPESASLSVESVLSAGDTDVLAWKASADDVDRSESCFSDMAHILKTSCIRPMLRQYGPAEWIDFALPDDGSKPGPFEAKLKTANTGKQRTDRHDV